MSANRDACLAQAATMLRGHPDWADDTIASCCKLSEAEVAAVRRQLEATGHLERV